MSKLQMVARCVIHDGKQDEFKAVARQLLEKVKPEKGTLTLQYDWFLSPDGRTCTVVESYPSSEACMQHMANVGPMLGALMALCSLEQVDLFGTPSGEVAKATAAMQPKVHSLFQSL
jgi:quinol monooxygenase YgiN